MTGRQQPQGWRSRFDPRRGQGLEPVQVGDCVYTSAGTAGRVNAAWHHRGVPYVTVSEDHGVDPPGDMPHRAENCVAIHGPHGSRQRCDARHDRAGRCARWAARTVTVWQTDEHGHPVVDEDGYQLAGTVTERAVCWDHLAAAVDWAEQRYGPTFELRLGAPTGGSTEPPDRAAGWDLDTPRRTPDLGIRPRERIVRELEGWER
ncbi:MAG: hypothetical protein ACRDZO_23110 [Egibacteraceae bacterium]